MELEVCIFPKFESCDDTLQPRTGNSQINKVTIGTMHSFACKSGEIPLLGISVKTVHNMHSHLLYSEPNES